MHLGIESSSTLEDLVASALAYPCVLVQMCDTVFRHLDHGCRFNRDVSALEKDTKPIKNQEGVGRRTMLVEEMNE